VVEIEFADGTRLSERISAVRGTPRNPMSRREVMEKAIDLTAPVLGGDKSKGLVNAVYAIETLTDIRNLQAFLQAGRLSRGAVLFRLRRNRSCPCLRSMSGVSLSQLADNYPT